MRFAKFEISVLQKRGFRIFRPWRHFKGAQVALESGEFWVMAMIKRDVCAGPEGVPRVGYSGVIVGSCRWLCMVCRIKYRNDRIFNMKCINLL